MERGRIWNSSADIGVWIDATCESRTTCWERVLQAVRAAFIVVGRAVKSILFHLSASRCPVRFCVCIRKDSMSSHRVIKGWGEPLFQMNKLSGCPVV